MSKGNMLLGQARGKVGSLVFSRADGKQIVRTRAEVVKNPRTRKQGIQRIIMNTASQVYSHLKDICDHSFEGVAYGQPSMNFFMTKALKELRAKVSGYNLRYDGQYSWVPVGQSFMPLQSLDISKGTLTSIHAYVPATGSSFTNYLQLFAMTDETISITNITYQQVMDKLNAKRGDQITLIMFVDVNGQLTKVVSRMILDPQSEGESAPLTSRFFNDDGGLNYQNELNENTDILNARVDFGFGFKPVIAGVARNVLMGAAIKSRQATDGSWLRSSEYLHYASNEVTTIANSDFASALDAYMTSNSIGGEDARYLNNATD